MTDIDPDFLLHHIQKIPPSTSEETLEKVLQILWETRKTGLGSSPGKRDEIQTLLALPSSHQLDPVLACLRFVIRKGVSDDDVQKLLPLDLPADLRGVIVSVFHKNRSRWRNEAPADGQPRWHRTRLSYQTIVNVPPVRAPNQTLDSMSFWPREDDEVNHPDSCRLGSSVAGFTDGRLPHGTSLPLHQDKDSSDNMAVIPRLKSMTWKMGSRSLTTENQLAVITLKLQDYTKSSSGEIEVKFQLSKDTLEAMLRSMAHISEQLSDTVLPEPSSKKQKQ